MQGKTAPHIEYEIDEEYRNQGVMTRHLPKYLNYCKKEEINQLLAIVKKDNIYSQRLLEKNDFVMLNELEDEFCYAIDLRLTKTITLEIMKKIKRDFNFDRAVEEAKNRKLP
jgi:RimJ/RimL family protein N-acetyltransferase